MLPFAAVRPALLHFFPALPITANLCLGENILNVRPYAMSVSVALNLLCVIAMQAQSRPVEISSPDHRITLRFAIKPDKELHSGDGQLVYAIGFRGRTMFEESSLRM